MLGAGVVTVAVAVAVAAAVVVVVVVVVAVGERVRTVCVLFWPCTCDGVHVTANRSAPALVPEVSHNYKTAQRPNVRTLTLDQDNPFLHPNHHITLT